MVKINMENISELIQGFESLAVEYDGYEISAASAYLFLHCHACINVSKEKLHEIVDDHFDNFVQRLKDE